MKIRSFITPFVFFSLGGFIVGALFLEYGIPNMYGHMATDAWSIKLNRGGENYDYSDVLAKYNLGLAYLWDPMYFYKRNKGYEILKGMAEDGYTPAANTLYGFHVNRMNHYKAEKNTEMFDKHYKLATQWAMAAAAQGDERPLMMLITADGFGLKIDVSEELKILDMWVVKSSLITAPKIMEKYYTKVGNAEKAAEMHKIYEERMKNPKPAPACTTITPWRGL